MMIDTIRPRRVGEFNRGGGMTLRKRLPKRTTGGSDIQNASDAEPTNILTTSTVVTDNSPQTIRLRVSVSVETSESVASCSVMSLLRSV